jgi:alkanesulfonate monooxygenase SsuD/methylene tetrahydromethanopterin reductase-like flavin-dependent oxidoreductase (luciferase family)
MQSVADFDGRYYQLREARCEPKPVQQPHPPVVIGGGGEQLTLRVVAQYAGIWDCMTDSPQEYRHKSAVLDSHWTRPGDD